MSEKMLSVYRKEVKFLLSLKDRAKMLKELDKILNRDVYSKYNGYRTRSVYFDGIYNDDYNDAINEEPIKKRIRIRIYNPSDKTAKFEIKRKNFGKELKESITISKEDAIHIINKNFSVILNYDTPISKYSYDLLSSRFYRPVSMVEYDRIAYTHEFFNTRVTLDSNLRYNCTNYNLFDENPYFYSGMEKDKTILEIKFDRFLLEQIQLLLDQCKLKRKPPSKYVTSRSLLEDYYY